MTFPRHQLLHTLPPLWPHSLQPQIQAQVQANGRKLFILDDDPLGCQTSYNLPIITDWSTASLRAELADNAPACFILTNSRSLPAAEAERMYEAIGRSLAHLEAETAQTFNILTRCDSTLRGHFPGEVEALQRGMKRPFAATLFIPFFAEGGRLTIHDTHYVSEGRHLIPAAQTPYAQDTLFGYQSSNLRQWVAEKMNGRLQPHHIPSISLTDIRQGGPERIAHLLQQLNDGRPCIVNAADYRDLEVFVQGLLAAEASGSHYLYRTAASFIPTRLGLPPRPLLTAADLQLPPTGGGLIIVGSHVPLTTRQLRPLLALPHIHSTELNINALLHPSSCQPEIERIITHMNHGLRQGQDVVIYTSRQLAAGDNQTQARQMGQLIAQSWQQIVPALDRQPRYLLVKGGITASDIAVQALSVQRAKVLGQLLPGVPVWQFGHESRFPGLGYVVFPGNVGDTLALATAVTRLRNGNS